MPIDPRARIQCGTDLQDLTGLRELRDEVFRSAGPADGIGILYGVGYTEGRADSLCLLGEFEAGDDSAPRFAGPGVPILFEPEAPPGALPFRGQLAASPEADCHLASFPAAQGPVCFASAGYAAGWYSGLLGTRIEVVELVCRASGAEVCRFEARTARGEGQPFETLDFDALDHWARELAGNREQTEGPMLGCFDPMSPAAHIWGPVMILPYSGGADCEQAIETVRNDIGPDAVRVVLVDVTGARIDALEAVALTRLLDRVEGLGIEPVLVGLDRNARGPFLQRGRELALPLTARDLAEGIALGFQLSRPQR